ncbi:MAG: hypothetical protein RLZZ292_952, partial [Bacteroidota bacterium]
MEHNYNKVNPTDFKKTYLPCANAHGYNKVNPTDFKNGINNPSNIQILKSVKSSIRLMFKYLFLLLNLLFVLNINAQNNNSDQILGKWMSAENDLKVEVFKQNGQYRAKVIWFACEHGIPMKNFYDSNNPDASLRSRPWLGLQVLDGLHYNGSTEWNNGSIY